MDLPTFVTTCPVRPAGQRGPVSREGCVEAAKRWPTIFPQCRSRSRNSGNERAWMKSWKSNPRRAAAARCVGAGCFAAQSRAPCFCGH